MMSCMQKLSAHTVPIEDMGQTFIAHERETAMTSQGHVTTASLKQANKEDNGEIVYPPASQKVLRINP